MSAHIWTPGHAGPLDELHEGHVAAVGIYDPSTAPGGQLTHDAVRDRALLLGGHRRVHTGGVGAVGAGGGSGLSLPSPRPRRGGGDWGEGEWENSGSFQNNVAKFRAHV